MFVLLAALIGFVIYFAVTRRRTYPYHGYEDMNSSENPANIAKTRFAKGEINKDELELILKNLK